MKHSVDPLQAGERGGRLIRFILANQCWQRLGWRISSFTSVHSSRRKDAAAFLAAAGLSLLRFRVSIALRILRNLSWLPTPSLSIGAPPSRERGRESEKKAQVIRR